MSELTQCPFERDGSFYCSECERKDYESCDMFKKKQKARQDVMEECERERKMNGINVVTVRWHDGYLEEFECTEVRFGSDLLWLRLKDGKNRHIPLRSVRWFGMTKESHQKTDGEQDDRS